MKTASIACFLLVSASVVAASAALAGYLLPPRQDPPAVALAGCNGCSAGTALEDPVPYAHWHVRTFASKTSTRECRVYAHIHDNIVSKIAVRRSVGGCPVDNVRDLDG